MTNWILITSDQDIEDMLDQSETTTCVVFKHSTTCPISSVAKMRVEDDWNFDDSITAYYVDVKMHRAQSLRLAEILDVHHESPQVIVVKNREVIYDNSHLDINIGELEEVVLQA